MAVEVVDETAVVEVHGGQARPRDSNVRVDELTDAVGDLEHRQAEEPLICRPRIVALRHCRIELVNEHSPGGPSLHDRQPLRRPEVMDDRRDRRV